MKQYSVYFVMSQAGDDYSHDWGGEFYHNREEAQSRAEYLGELCDEKFIVMQGAVTVYDDKKGDKPK